MAIGLVKDSSVARDGADQGLGGIVDGRCCGECAARPSEGIPNGGTQVLAVCAAPGQLDYSATLALQQHGQQSALRKGRRHNFLFSLSKRWTIFAGIPFIPSGRFASRDPDKSSDCVAVSLRVCEWSFAQKSVLMCDR
jgi:hypothetical protein